MSDLLGSLGIDTGIVVLILIVMVVILLVSLISTNLRLSRLEQKYKIFMKGKDAKSLEAAFTRKMMQIDKLSELTDRYLEDSNQIKKNFQHIYSKYGVEKYDAFDDVGGKLSFALAMFDRENSGLVLNAVHSRDNCFLYLKEIVKGESYVMLSQEEVEALRRAVNYGIEDLEKEL